MVAPMQAAPITPMIDQDRRYTQSSLPQNLPTGGQSEDSEQNHPVTGFPSQLSTNPNFPSPFDERIPTPNANPFSPPFAFSPMSQGSFSPVFITNPPPANCSRGSQAAGAYYEMSKQMQAVVTPGVRSLSGSTHANNDVEKDPFLTLLEELAENEYSRAGPSDLDSYLGGDGQ